MKISEKFGFTKNKIEIQKSSMDQGLRIRIWNAIYLFLEIGDYTKYTQRSQNFSTYFKIWDEFFKFSIDKIPSNLGTFTEYLKADFLKLEWYEVYDFLEFIVQQYNESSSLIFIKECNIILEQELSAYRFVGKRIGQITSEDEIIAIEEAIDKTEKFKYEGAHVHLGKSIDYLFNKKSPDYNNSIKESISSIEFLVREMLGKPDIILSAGIKEFGKINGLHLSLVEAFVKLYAFTSDEGGIRHAFKGQNNVDFEVAKFYLVICSAFANYLISIHGVNKKMGDK
jgi:hypothetical protein